MFKLQCRNPICRSSTYREVKNHGFYGTTLAIQFIFSANRVTDKMLPCSTPLVCTWVSESVLLTLTLNFHSLKNSCTYFGRHPLSPAVYMSRKIPYLHAASYVFSKSKNTDTICYLRAKLFRTSLSNLTR